jgi:Flp pilus assembly protein TadG
MIRNNQAGQVLVSAALMLVVLLGFAGLGIDMGIIRYQKRLQQSAADSAAIAGATNLPPYTGYQTAGQNAAASNGFTDNTGGGACATPPTALAVGSVTVTLCQGPLIGPHAGDANYVEAYVTAGQPTYFMRLLGVNNETITARAVATNFSGSTPGANYGCLYTLGTPSASIEGVSLGGHAFLKAPSCGIVDNGNFNTTGNNIDVSASTFGVSGSRNGGGSAGGTITCSAGVSSCPSYGTPAAPDPMTPSLTPPCTYTCSMPGTTISINGGGNTNCGTGCTFANGVYTISQGTYTKITIQGVSSDQVVFSPGVYIFDGTSTNYNNPDGLMIPGNATISGTGVTFFFTNTATVQITGNPTINLSAPSSGTYQGILMWQDKNDLNVGPSPQGPTLSGNSGSQFNGILYFPSDQLTFGGNGVGFGVGVVVSDSLALQGSPIVSFSGVTGVPGGLPPSFTVTTTTLVE